MEEFGNLAAFAAHIAGLEVAVHRNLENGLEKVAAKVEKTAKAEIGHYQEGIAPFQKWEQLADSTKEDRVSKGFSENAPGLRSGTMRESISHSRQGLDAEVGSTDQNLVWFELGTSKQPPRSVLGLAVEKNRDAIGKVLGGAAVNGLLGNSVAQAVIPSQVI